MPLVPGSRLGPYEILAPIGAGGMGEVYKAKDTRLERFVAVKVLPGQLAVDPVALARFEREARAVAALNHPNILGIHDLGTHEETAFVVMELLEGESVRARLEQGPLPARKATELAIQMAEGLAAAHEKGVIHRDLKPGNLWITKAGRLKILDFGLAKQVSAPGAGSDSLQPTATVSHDAHTAHGTIVGTLGYMSPEQVRGEPVDSRSDIFSFGVVLYELLTGQRAFARASASETMAAILRDDPAEDVLVGKSLPAGLQRLVLRCLEKQPGRRFQGAADLRFALELALSDSGSRAAAADAAPPRRAFSSRRGVAGGAACLALGAALAWFLRGSPAPNPAIPIRVVTYSGHDSSPATSPDGRTIAFTSDRDGKPRIWLRQLKGGGEQAITAGPDDHARFSPDGASILFIRTEGGVGSVYRITLLGSDSHKVAEDAEQADWSPDGNRIAFVRLQNRPDTLFSALYLIDAGGGTERELARFPGLLTGYPRWSPDGRQIIVDTPPIISSGVHRKFVLVDAKGGRCVDILPASVGMLSAAAWASRDEIVYLQSESITGGGTAVSAARGYLQDVRTKRTRPLFWVGCSGTVLDLLPDGRVIFDAMSGRQNLREYTLDGSIRPRWITHGTINDRQPVFDPAGEWVVFSSNRSGNLDLWAISTRTGVVRSITDDPADDWDPAFSPDGRSILWSSNRSGNLEVWASNLDGTGAHQVTHDGEDAQNPTQTRDGKWIVYSCANHLHTGLWKIHPDGTGAVQVAHGAVQIPEVSPDGLYATYMTALPTKATLHVIRLDSGVERAFAVLSAVVRKTSVFPCRSRWTPDGRHILFTGQNERGLDGVFIQDFVPGTDTSPTRRELAGFDPDWITESLGLSPDGKRLVLSEPERVFSLMVAEGVEGLGTRGGSAR